jgi:hypothetical protein
VKRLVALNLRAAGLTAVLAFGVASSGWAQAPPPLAGQRGQSAAPAQTNAGAAQAAAPANLPTSPVVSPLAAVSAEVKGPGAMFPALFSMPKGDDFDHFGYEAHEYFVTGTANGQPYETRIVIRKPKDDRRYSGLILAESMHPSGNAWMFHFTHRYTMDSGHIGVEIVTSGLPLFLDHNEARYKRMKVEPAQVNEIIAQVGTLLKSKDASNPLRALPTRKMVLGGTSASAAALVRYLPAHMVYRLADMKPIYDGFLPTSTAAEIQKVDVPMIEVPTMTEVGSGQLVVRQDGDAPSDQFRVYELAGIAHLDTRDVEPFRPNPCANPISLHPIGTGFSLALSYLLQWVDKGQAPPHAARILVDRDMTNDGSMMALDEHGNARGGVPSVYVNVPVAQYAVRNEAAKPYPKNLHPWADRGEAGVQALCRLTAYQRDFTRDQLATLYGTKAAYRAKVAESFDALSRAGWVLPVYKDVVLADADKVEF